jgi:hypothetical protein
LDANGKQGFVLLQKVYDDNQRKNAWKEKFKELGKTDKVRETYEWYAWETDHWLRTNLRIVYDLIPDPESVATEADYAFFLDLSMHTGHTGYLKKKRAQAKEFPCVARGFSRAQLQVLMSTQVPNKATA